MAKQDGGGGVGKLAAKSAASPSSVLSPTVDADDIANAGPAGEPAPDIRRTEAAVETPAARSISIVVLAVLATLYTMYFARDFFVPIVFAILLNFLLSPVIRALARFRIPPSAGAAVVVLLLIGAIGGGVYSLAGPAQTFADSAPEALTKANKKLRTLILARVQKATSQVERAAGTLGDSVGQRAPRQIVVNSSPTIGSRILGTTQVVVAAILEIVILLYFLLAGGDLFLQKFIKVLPQSGDKRKAVEIARGTEVRRVSLPIDGTARECRRRDRRRAVAVGAQDAESRAVGCDGRDRGVRSVSRRAHGSRGSRIGRVDDVRQHRARVADPRQLSRGQSDSGEHRHTGTAGASPDVESRGDFRRADVLLLDLGCGRRLFGRAAARPLKIFCDHVGSLAALGEFLGERDDSERRRTIRGPGQQEQRRSMSRA